jgi:cytoskeletal protein CcmA (bactofilin family)
VANHDGYRLMLVVNARVSPLPMVFEFAFMLNRPVEWSSQSVRDKVQFSVDLRPKETNVSYFFAGEIQSEAGQCGEAAAPAAVAPVNTDIMSIGEGTVITGNIVCAGGLQIYGHVRGEIHASHLTICEGAMGAKVTAQHAVIQGQFKGTIRGNSVKLQSSAAVDGEIFNGSLSIEQNAQFEGRSRRLDRPVEALCSTPLTPSNRAASPHRSSAR